MKITRLLATTLLLAGGAACANNDDNPTLQAPSASAPGATTQQPTATPKGTGTAEVRAMRFNTFNPDKVSIKVGQTVTVLDTDDYAPHNFVVKGVGRSPTLNMGDTYTLRFAKAGTYRFVCTFHESKGMVGTITVTPS
jgi:plastocyanin